MWRNRRQVWTCLVVFMSVYQNTGLEVFLRALVHDISRGLRRERIALPDNQGGKHICRCSVQIHDEIHGRFFFFTELRAQQIVDFHGSFLFYRQSEALCCPSPSGCHCISRELTIQIRVYESLVCHVCFRISDQGPEFKRVFLFPSFHLPFESLDTKHSGVFVSVCSADDRNGTDQWCCLFHDWISCAGHKREEKIECCSNKKYRATDIFVHSAP
mmetsp:Transcript_17084/g.39038  ORF Transcript_17084/g.39038 Transcript_17084/m.39038 type:complete len:215 (-) Transcript_17084:52-696(-)